MNKLDLMKQAAREAGEFMLGTDDRESTDKSNTKDFVTVADIKAQNIIRDKLQAEYPEALILSEEDDEPTRATMFEPSFTGFVLDPIDGTYNFKRDMRESAISIGYIEKGEPILGIIFDPYKNEIFEAEKGKGAFKNDQPIEVSKQSSLSGASVATGNSYEEEAMARNLRRHLAIYEQAGEMPWTSCPGSGVLVMAWIACGRIDAYHHNGLKPWDNAAAFLLVREAGGEVQTLSGEQANFLKPAVLVGNKQIVQIIRSIFNNMDAELLN